MLKKIILFFIMVLFVISSFATSYDEALSLYKARKLDDAIKMLKALEANVSGEEAIKVYTLLGKCYWKKGKSYTKDKDAKMKLFNKGRDTLVRGAEKISGKKLDINEDYEGFENMTDKVEFLYWMALLHGEYGSAKGIMESLSLVKPIKKLCRRVIEIDPSYEDGGAYLVLGRMYYKLPGLFGGDNDESIRYLKMARAYQDKKPEADRSHTSYKFLAETYMDEKEWSKAKEALEAGLKCPKNSDAPSEDDADYIEMKELLKKVNEKL